jgi:hypothetical protein
MSGHAIQCNELDHFLTMYNTTPAAAANSSTVQQLDEVLVNPNILVSTKVSGFE